MEHVGQQFRVCLIHLLATRISFPEREREEFPALISLESVQVIFLQILRPMLHAGFNIGGIKFGDFLLDLQLAKLKTLPNFPLYGMLIVQELTPCKA